MKADQLLLENVEELSLHEQQEICGGSPNIHSGLVYDITYKITWFVCKIVKNTMEGVY